jgi:Protein of unknown function (DUF3309)
LQSATARTARGSIVLEQLNDFGVEKWACICGGINMLSTILIIILILALLGALPSWGYSRAWGYGPSGGLGIVLIIVLILVLTGRF